MLEWIKNNPTLIIAIYGAILSTITIVWSIYTSLQDKPKIKISGDFGYITSTERLNGPLLLIKAINKGKRSVNLSSVGIRLERNLDFINLKPFGLPLQLKEGKSHTEWFNLEELKDKKCLFVWYKDETGKLYQSKNIKKRLDNYFSGK